MGKFNQGGRTWDNRGNKGGGFRGGFRGGRGFGDHDRGRHMYTATCFECGQQCEVPFKPSGEKPVYCTECFKGGGRSTSQPKKEHEGSHFDEKLKRPEAQELKEQFERLNTKLDRVIKMLAPIITPEAKREKEVDVKKSEATKKPAKKATKKPATKKETKKKK